ncbi:hypothetical protein M885DRAFT_541041 [Pelagophyceae sp. CCMP2097]|nr:hypothetical protein M885DRAFT_541041 [Pelagophyceae sp. CCMP2097]
MTAAARLPIRRFARSRRGALRADGRHVCDGPVPLEADCSAAPLHKARAPISVLALRRIGRHPWRWFNSAIRTEEEIGATRSLQHNSCLRLSRPVLNRASDCRAEDAADSGA